MNHSRFFIPILFLVVLQTGFAQISGSTSPMQAKMGLFDINLSYGYMATSRHRSDYLNNSQENMNTKSHFINLHFDEGMISNWWSADSQTRLLFGIRECLDLGFGKKTTTTVGGYLAPGSVIEKNQFKKNEFIFTYEGGLGAVYRINNKMDAGLDLYFISISTFNKDSSPINYVPKFRFRYTNYQAELVVRARTSIGFKYLFPFEDGSGSRYIGLTYMTTKGPNYSANNFTDTMKSNIFQFNVGFQL
jgi:hypothetical protein